MTNEEVNKLKEDIKSISDNPLFNMVGRDTLLEIVLEKIDMLVESEEEQQPCEDAVSRQALIDKATSWDAHFADSERAVSLTDIMSLPPVTPKFTDEEIQKMQELEQAQLDKAYELGKIESFEEWLSSFNTESAPQCFTAVQELKKKLEDEE